MGEARAQGEGGEVERGKVGEERMGVREWEGWWGMGGQERYGREEGGQV